MSRRGWAPRRAVGRPGSLDEAVRTRAVLALGVDGIGPHWLERQLDPRSPAFVPRGHLPAVLTNLTSRDWTTVGTVASTSKGIVDQRGLLTPWEDGWSLDWWVGAEDRWHFPSREAAVRQQLVADTPVVETAMRIPGGDAVHRVYAVPGEDGPLAIVEITNATPTPFAVALAVRPYNPDGLAVVGRIGLSSSDRTVTVDGRPALLLPRAPQRMAASTVHDGDAAEIVTSGRAGTEWPADLRCDVGLATGAFLFPLAHRATMRLAVPLEPDDATPRSAVRRGGRRPQLPEPVPESDAVVRSWQAQTSSRGLRLVLPEGRLASAVEANRRFLLLLHEGTDVVPGPFTSHRFGFRDAASLLRALDRYGFHGESAEVVGSFRSRQRADGSFSDGHHDGEATGAALYAMGEHWRLTGALDAVDVDAVAKAIRWIQRKRPTSAAALDLWSRRGLLDGAALLRAFGFDDLAAEAEGSAEAGRRDYEASMAQAAARLGDDVLPAGPGRRVDPGIIGTLDAVAPLRLFAHDHPTVRATLEAVRQRFCVGPAVYEGISHTGLSPLLTLQLAEVELGAGDRTCLERLAWLVDAATTTFTWPEAIHPGLGGGCMGEGHHGRAAAELLSFVRDLLVREDDGGLDLVTLLPDAWAGHNLEVHDAPTHFGFLSFAVRWHGDRPALLWDLRRRAGADGEIRLRAPGLDPSWSTTAAKGEALLAAGALPHRPPEALPDIEGSFS